MNKPFAYGEQADQRTCTDCERAVQSARLFDANSLADSVVRFMYKAA